MAHQGTLHGVSWFQPAGSLPPYGLIVPGYIPVQGVR